MTQKALVDGNIEYAFNTSTSDAADTTSFGNGSTGNTFVGPLTASRNKRVRFLTPILSTDTLSLQIQAPSGQWVPVAGFDGSVGIHNYMYQNGTSYGMGLQSAAALPSTDIDVQFGTSQWASSTYGAAGAAWSTSSGRWRVKKSAN